MHPLVTRLLDEPTAPRLLAEAQAALRGERARRRRFYQQVSENEKTEFINGEIIVHSPVKQRHNRVTLLLGQLMNVYANRHQLGFVGIEKILVALSRTDYEPDVCYFAAALAATFTPDQVRFPAPNWIVEVLSPATQARDRGVKFTDYAAHGVKEYWLVDPEAEQIEQYLLDGDVYRLAHRRRQGTLRAVAMAGFQVPVRAVFDADENLRALTALLR